MTRKNSKKILNNSYRTNDNLKGDEYEFSNKISVDESSVSVFMKDTCGIDGINYYDIINIINGIIDRDDIIRELCARDNSKYTDVEVNHCFSYIYGNMYLDAGNVKLSNMAYVFDIISNVLSMQHDVLFGMLSYDNKATVISEFITESGIDITKSVRFVF